MAEKCLFSFRKICFVGLMFIDNFKLLDCRTVLFGFAKIRGTKKFACEFANF